MLDRLAQYLTAPLTTASQLPAVSGDVAQVADLPTDVQAAFGINGTTTAVAPVTRDAAMQVPAFARGRALICGTIGALSLRVLAGSREVPAVLVDRPDPNTTRQYVITWTVDDLLCYGVAWWRVTSRDTAGFPVSAERVHPARIRVDYDRGRISVDGRDVDPSEMIRFDGHADPVLKTAADVIRGALALERASRRYAENPQPATVLVDKRPLDRDIRDLTQSEVAALLDAWKKGNNAESGGTRFLPRTVGLESVSWDPQQLDLQNARNTSAVQIARALNLPSRQVNAPSESSMTYQNVSSDRQEFIDLTAAPYLAAIEQRLSMDDVTPHGHLVTFDRDGFTAGTVTDRIANAAAFVNAHLGTPDEARALYLNIPAAPARPTLPVKETTP